jgi:hypothetical protein
MPPALVGHLLLANHTRTDLGDVLGLRQRYGSVPVHMPVSGLGEGFDELREDRQTCVIRHAYRPDLDQLRVIPVDVRVDLLDPDSTNDAYISEAFDTIRRPPHGMTQQVSFRSHLILRVVVRATVPKADGEREPSPEVAKMSLCWPTITSLRAVRLRVQDEDGDEEAPIRYNPLTRSIEWSDVAMSALDTEDDSDTRTYRSDAMFVLVEQPGELYRQESIEGTVEVRIDDYLLSGVEARFANAVGRLDADVQPEHVTYLDADVKLILDDAFAKRMVSPYQHLHFDEIIPDRMRINDIEAALNDRGFDVEVSGADDKVTHLRAERSEGATRMVLWLQVEGKEFETEREIRRPGGLTHTTKIKSGELKVFIRGSFQRDSLQVIREMNALQLALRERFSRLRANH